MDWMLNYLPQVLMSIGIIALIIEVVVLGFATFILFFIGLALFITGLSMYLGWLDASVNMAMWSSIILTFGFALILWKPFKKLQNKQVTQDTSSDFAQETFVLTGDVNRTSNDVLHAYSGINWKVRSEQPLTAGQTVKVVKTEVGILWVIAVN
ncbi:NfeD family protein [Vibrio rumoiensis]|uniref:Activity regulator of membrane protease YbbK n=1 Tax=Vibrio rumoiensis 1S-45 TaxID=1188252 RepID=A0A1E5E0D1_9VIBR|nr:NfeD family protein [Vibrio rumoiensis]OEF23520.1 activity regulator of membrane protease YbbK [Vibrio rumoiensis 1S-45]